MATLSSLFGVTDGVACAVEPCGAKGDTDQVFVALGVTDGLFSEVLACCITVFAFFGEGGGDAFTGGFATYETKCAVARPDGFGCVGAIVADVACCFLYDDSGAFSGFGTVESWILSGFADSLFVAAVATVLGGAVFAHTDRNGVPVSIFCECQAGCATIGGVACATRRAGAFLEAVGFVFGSDGDAAVSAGTGARAAACTSCWVAGGTALFALSALAGVPGTTWCALRIDDAARGACGAALFAAKAEDITGIAGAAWCAFGACDAKGWALCGCLTGTRTALCAVSTGGTCAICIGCAGAWAGGLVLACAADATGAVSTCWCDTVGTCGAGTGAYIADAFVVDALFFVATTWEVAILIDATERGTRISVLALSRNAFGFGATSGDAAIAIGPTTTTECLWIFALTCDAFGFASASAAAFCIAATGAWASGCCTLTRLAGGAVGAACAIGICSTGTGAEWLCAYTSLACGAVVGAVFAVAVVGASSGAFVLLLLAALAFDAVVQAKLAVCTLDIFGTA